MIGAGGVDANVVFGVEIDHRLQKGLGKRLVDRAIGERRGDRVEFVVCQDQRAVEDDVTRGVGVHGDACRAALQRNGEQAQRRANAKLSVHQISLNEGISDIKIVLSLVAQISVGFTDQIYQIAITLPGRIIAGEILIRNVGKHDQ